MALVTVFTSFPSDWAPPRAFSVLERLAGSAETALVRLGGGEPRLLQLFGSGFAYGPTGLPEAGTVTSFRVLAGESLATAVLLHEVAEISVAAAALAGATDLPALLFAGADTLRGEAGNDAFLGGAGAGLLEPGSGRDMARGGRQRHDAADRDLAARRLRRTL